MNWSSKETQENWLKRGKTGVAKFRFVSYLVSKGTVVLCQWGGGRAITRQSGFKCTLATIDSF